MQVTDSAKVQRFALDEQVNLRIIDATTVGVSMDETTKLEDLDVLFKCVRAHVYVCVHACDVCAHACVRLWMHACARHVCECMRACVCVPVRVFK